MLKINLKNILKNRGMTLTDLSKNTGITMKTLSALQNKQVESIQFKTIEQITRVLNIEINDLLIIDEYRVHLDVSLKEHQNTLSLNCKLNRVSEHEQTHILIHFLLKFKMVKIKNNLILEYYGGADKKIIKYIKEDMKFDIKEFLEVISYSLVQEIALSHFLTSKNNIIVDFTSLLNNYINENLDIMKDEKRFTPVGSHYYIEPMIFPIKLCPMNPFIHLTQLDLNGLQLTANIEILDKLNIIDFIDIDKKHSKRKIYLSK